MNLYALISLIFSIAVLITYFNHRFVKLQSTIAIMAASLVLSLVLLIIGQFGFHGLEAHVSDALSRIDFHDLLINGMLSFLLFAGALHIDINDLKKYRWEIGILSTLGTIASAVIVGYLTFYALGLFGVQLKLIYCMLFGALISPTDPIAVLSIFKQVGAPRGLEVTVEGESLFNDGVGIVIFLTIYQLAFNGKSPTIETVSFLFLQQAIGGIIYGGIIGYLAYLLIKPIDNHKVEILVTLLITTGGYALAQGMHISGPLAMVVAGIFIGNRGRKFHMSKKTRDNLDSFWELIDEILNAILFLMIGLELLVIHISPGEIGAALFAIPLVLAVRWFTVATPMTLFKLKRKYCPHMINILVWGGLRGGLAVALALSIPASHERHVILALTYAVVVFAIVVQGMTTKPLVRKAENSHSVPES